MFFLCREGRCRRFRSMSLCPGVDGWPIGAQCDHAPRCLMPGEVQFFTGIHELYAHFSAARKATEPSAAASMGHRKNTSVGGILRATAPPRAFGAHTTAARFKHRRAERRCD